MAIQVTLSANQFNYSGTYNGRNYDSLQVKYTSKGRIYFSIVRDGIRLCEMAKQVKFEEGNAIVSFGKNDKLIVGTYEDDTVQEVIEEVVTETIEEATEETNNSTDTTNQLESELEQPIKEDKGVNQMETKSINKLSNKDLTNILTKFAAMSETNPALNYGYYNGQSMYATDSHKIISIDKSLIDYLNNESDTHIFDILKGEKSDDQVKYPSVERLFDTYSNEEFTINKKNITHLSKLIKTIKANLNERYLYNIKLQFETVHNELMIMGYTQNGDYKETEYFNTGITANNISFILNAVFLADTLNTHKKLMKLTGDKELTVSYTGHLRPIKFNLQSGLVNVLLMPIRKY